MMLLLLSISCYCYFYCIIYLLLLFMHVIFAVVIAFYLLLLPLHYTVMVAKIACNLHQIQHNSLFAVASALPCTHRSLHGDAPSPLFKVVGCLRYNHTDFPIHSIAYKPQILFSSLEEKSQDCVKHCINRQLLDNSATNCIGWEGAEYMKGIGLDNTKTVAQHGH